MFLDKGIDTGNIIHQIRPRINLNEDYYEISAKFIIQMSAVYSEIIKNFEKIKIKEIKRDKIISHLYKRKDFSDESLKKLRLNLKTDYYLSI